MDEHLRQLETELEALRQELQRAQEKQRAGDESFRRFSDSGIIGIALLALSGKILFANEAFLRMIACQSEDLAGENLRWDQVTTPEWSWHITEAMEALKTRGSCDPFEAEYLRQDGTRFWGLFTGVRVDDQSVAAFLLDVTQRRQAEEALRQQAEELKRADRAKDLFLAMLGHELRTPLSTLTGALQILQRQRERPPELVRLHHRMERQVERLGRLIDDLQDVSRIVRGQFALHFEPLDLVALVRETSEDQRGSFGERNLALRLDLPDASIMVKGDRTRLAQVLVNLLNNAGKFTDPGGQVTIRLVRNRRRAAVEVLDSGIGIEPAMLPHLFESFAQAECSLDRSRGGLGLGLALVKGIVDLHGGHVRAASQGTGRGATFTVELPLLTSEG